jgi:nucleoside phosphorylase
MENGISCTRTVTRFRPRVAMFVGVAGGIKDVAIGDVVAATKVYAYEGGKETRSGFQPRPELRHAAYSLAQRARMVAREAKWQDRLIQNGPSPDRYKLFVGPIAAGEKVLAFQTGAVAQFIRQQYGDSLAVEMEGIGFLETVHLHPSVEAIVIRGISDLLSGKSRGRCRRVAATSS